MTKTQATKKAEAERKWHKMGYQDMEFKRPARAVKVPGGYACVCRRTKEQTCAVVAHVFIPYTEFEE